MRRVKFMMLLPIGTLLALVTPVAAAQAAPTATTAAAQATTFTCYPNTPASFTISNTTVSSNQVTTTIADGTPIPGGFVAQSDPPNFLPSKTTGSDVASFTNNTTGHTILHHEGGTQWFTYDPTPEVPGALATGTFVSTGTTSELFGPQSEAALEAAGIHEPALVLVSGLLVMRFAVNQSGPYVTSFSLRGTQRNGCALLAGS
jgi:hypothetical protein